MACWGTRVLQHLQDNGSQQGPEGLSLTPPQQGNKTTLYLFEYPFTLNDLTALRYTFFFLFRGKST